MKCAVNLDVRSNYLGPSLVVVVLLVISPVCHSKLIRVPTDSANIQLAVNQAKESDTVLVGPGVYRGIGNYDIDPMGFNVAILSESGPTVTVIDCRDIPKDSIAAAFWLHSGEDSCTIIAGFTIICAPMGILKRDEVKIGGGISIYGSNQMPTSASIYNNIFIGNSSSISSGISTVRAGVTRIIGNEFRECGVYARIQTFPLSIESNRFYARSQQMMLNIAPYGKSNSPHIISGNIFCGSRLVRGWGVLIQCDGDAFSNVVINGNEFYAFGFRALALFEDKGDLNVKVDNCSFIYNQMGIDGFFGKSVVEVNNCLFTMNKQNTRRISDSFFNRFK